MIIVGGSRHNTVASDFVADIAIERGYVQMDELREEEPLVLSHANRDIPAEMDTFNIEVYKLHKFYYRGYRNPEAFLALESLQTHVAYNLFNEVKNDKR